MLLAVVLLALPAAAQAQPNARQTVPHGPAADAAAIVAVVNGDVISRGDIDNRRRLFALSAGMPATADVLDRLTPQVTRQLIDERLQLQEAQRRKIVVTDKEIADAIGDLEKRNNLPPGALRQRLAAAHVDLRTLIDQLRVQIGWARVLRQVMQGGTDVSDAELAEQANIFKAETGQTEYRVAEIFVPVSEPAKADEAKQFADTVITQLRAGAPFSIIAAQFSQSQTALQGGDLGWVDPTQLDPDVLRVVKEMPVGAVSNPIRVPGGYTIVTLRASRQIGKDVATMLNVRQVFFPFATKLDPANPTAQQREALEASRKLATTAKSCADMDEAQKKIGGTKPADPGEIRLETISVPALRQVLSTLPPGKPTQPLIAEDGIAGIMGVLSRREECRLAQQAGVERQDRQRTRRAGIAAVGARPGTPGGDRSTLLRSLCLPCGRCSRGTVWTQRRSLGQHFLLDLNLTAAIVRQAGPLAGRHVVEVGPGPGGLTRAVLATEAASVLAVEVDPRAVAAIQELAQVNPARLVVLQGDALALDLPAMLPAPRQLVANLPYNIASPLLVGWLRQAACWERLTLIVPAGGRGADCCCACQQRLRAAVGAYAVAVRCGSPVAHPAGGVRPGAENLVGGGGSDAARAATGRGFVPCHGARHRRRIRPAAKDAAWLDGRRWVALPCWRRAGIVSERRAETLSVAEFDTLARLVAGGGSDANPVA